MPTKGSPLRAAAVAGAGALVFASVLGGCAGGTRSETAAHTAFSAAVSASASASASAALSPTPSASASPPSAAPSSTPSQAPSSVAARGVSGSTPGPATHTTAASTSNLRAVVTVSYGQVSFVSLSGETLCISVPVTVSNTGDGRVYSFELSASVSEWTHSTGKIAFAVSARSSRQATFPMCYSGFTQPGGVCYQARVGSDYWADPDTALGGLGGESTSVFCIPRQP